MKEMPPLEKIRIIRGLHLSPELHVHRQGQSCR